MGIIKNYHQPFKPLTFSIAKIFNRRYKQLIKSSNLSKNLPNPENHRNGSKYRCFFKLSHLLVGTSWSNQSKIHFKMPLKQSKTRTNLKQNPG